jgi:hypothetical protein
VTHRALLPVVLAALAACGQSRVELSPADRALGQTVGIADSLLLLIKRAGGNLRRLEGVTPDGDPMPAAGVTVDVSQSGAVPTVRRLRQVLGPGYLVFVSEQNFGIKAQPDHVSILGGTDPYALLRVMGTNGWNYNISPDSIVVRLQRWDAAFGLDLQGVGFDWLEAEFRRLPPDMMAFAKEIYEFCPDVVDQGTETVEALAKEMRRSNRLYLWWD